MAFIFLTTVCFLLIDLLLLDIHAVITIGKSSGVKPTATEIEKRNATIQLPFVIPFATKTIGIKKSMNLISTHDIEYAPISKPFLDVLLVVSTFE